MEKFIENLNKAASLLQTADHLLYMTYPLIREKRLLLKILSDINTATANIINAILQYEYFYKRINLYKEGKTNFQTFKEKCASRYNINQEQITKILEIFDLTEKHKKSPFEFVRNDKIVIMNNAIRIDTITIEKMKDYIFLCKDLLRKAENVIRARK